MSAYIIVVDDRTGNVHAVAWPPNPFDSVMRTECDLPLVEGRVAALSDLIHPPYQCGACALTVKGVDDE